MVDTPRQARPEINRVVSVGWRPTNWGRWNSYKERSPEKKKKIKVPEEKKVSKKRKCPRSQKVSKEVKQCKWTYRKEQWMNDDMCGWMFPLGVWGVGWYCNFSNIFWRFSNIFWRSPLHCEKTAKGETARQKEQEETKRHVQITKEEEETKRQAQAHSQPSTQQEGGEGPGQASRVGHRPTLPKLPAFRDKTDDIDSYLFRFETHATALKWDRAHWVTYLSALLEGTALTLFHSLSDTEDGTVTYEQLKSALLKKFQCTPEGFRKRFRESKPKKKKIKVPEEKKVSKKRKCPRSQKVSKEVKQCKWTYRKEQWMNDDMCGWMFPLGVWGVGWYCNFSNIFWRSPLHCEKIVCCDVRCERRDLWKTSVTCTTICSQIDRGIPFSVYPSSAPHPGRYNAHTHTHPHQCHLTVADLHDTGPWFQHTETASLA